ncbi:hypothetical protein ABFS83_09G021200 [Erythranthe nasuta]
MEDFSILAIPNSLSLFLLYIIINSKKGLGFQTANIGSMISFFDRPVRRPAWLYSYMFRLAGHYGYSGMASQRGGVLLKKMDRWEPNINIAKWPTKPRIIARESKVSKDRRISNSPRSGKKRSK